MARAYDLSGLGYGLVTEKQHHINKLLMDYDPNLSLRRIQESDPAFAEGMRHTPPKVFGVWEENVAPGQPNWVFTLAEMSIDERVLARVMMNDFRRRGASEQFAKYDALQRAQEASRLKAEIDKAAEVRDEQLAIGRLAAKKSTFRHKIAGRDVIIGDTIRPARAHL